MLKRAREKNYLTERAARELADGIIRKAIQEQARELEKHLSDINRRLVELEKNR